MNQIENHHLEDETEVEIASAGDRIVAYIINRFLEILACSPIIFAFFFLIFNLMSDDSEPKGSFDFSKYGYQLNGTLVLVGILLYAVLSVVQIVMMSKTGQSIGKKIMGIAVICEDGSKAGFVSVVLLREVAYMIILGIVNGVLSIVLFSSFSSDSSGQLMLLLRDQIVPTLCLIACLVMLFTHKDSRTLQDLLAKTVVVKLPR